jgi:hypothetical protein
LKGGRKRPINNNATKKGTSSQGHSAQQCGLVPSILNLSRIDGDIQSVTPKHCLSLFEARGVAVIHELLDQTVKVFCV